MKMVSNPDRETVGGRAAIGLRHGDATKATVGVDYQTNKHTLRSTMNQTIDSHTSDMAATEDANFRNYGLFGELTHYLGERDKLIAGLRADNWNAEDKRATLHHRTRHAVMHMANPTAGKDAEQNTDQRLRAVTSTTVRCACHALMPGFGHTERFPDYWELISATKESATTLSAFDSRPEKTNQLDVGIDLQRPGSGRPRCPASTARSTTIIMMQSELGQGRPPDRTITVTRNVDATTWGARSGAGYTSWPETWKLTPLWPMCAATTTPTARRWRNCRRWKGRLGLSYDNKVWSVGAPAAHGFRARSF